MFTKLGFITAYVPLCSFEIYEFGTLWVIDNITFEKETHRPAQYLQEKDTIFSLTHIIHYGLS